jgi:hypothetical protein
MSYVRHDVLMNAAAIALIGSCGHSGLCGVPEPLIQIFRYREGGGGYICPEVSLAQESALLGFRLCVGAVEALDVA